MTDRPDDGSPFEGQVYHRLLAERIVFFRGEVSDPIANAICGQLLLLSAEDPDRDIWMFVNSPGGSVTAGMAVYDTMRYIPNDVATVVLGFAASMGQFLLTAGTRGKRYALPHARVLMHQPSGGIGGSATDIAIQAENLRHVKRTIQRITADRTGRTVEEIERDADRDRWFTADQAVAYGLVDRVIQRVEDLSAGGRDADGGQAASRT